MYLKFFKLKPRLYIRTIRRPCVIKIVFLFAALIPSCALFDYVPAALYIHRILDTITRDAKTEYPKLFTVHELYVGHFFFFYGAGPFQKCLGRHVQLQRVNDERNAIDFLHSQDFYAQIVRKLFAEFLDDFRERFLVNPFRIYARRTRRLYYRRVSRCACSYIIYILRAAYYYDTRDVIYLRVNTIWISITWRIHNYWTIWRNAKLYEIGTRTWVLLDVNNMGEEERRTWWKY